jgi:hypothetical protein
MNPGDICYIPLSVGVTKLFDLENIFITPKGEAVAVVRLEAPMAGKAITSVVYV